MDTQLFGSADAVEALFSPASEEPFFVYVGRSDRLAKRQFADYERLKTPETFQALRGNVVAISDSGLTNADRKRVTVAMRLLREPETVSASPSAASDRLRLLLRA